MKRRPKRRPPDRLPCRETGPDDGIDPRYYFRAPTGNRSWDRKTLQLCAQVARAVTWALGSALDDERLQDLEVLRVEPAPDARRLRVLLRPQGSPREPPGQIQARLDRVLPHVRRAVAEGIHRRRTPDLVLVIRYEAGDVA